MVPLVGRTIIPADVVPSPQLMIAWKLPAPAPSESLNAATVPENGWPALAPRLGLVVEILAAVVVTPPGQTVTSWGGTASDETVGIWSRPGDAP